jgi:hypothetical protein
MVLLLACRKEADTQEPQPNCTGTEKHTQQGQQKAEARRQETKQVASPPPTEEDGATRTSLDGGATHVSPPDRADEPSGQDTSLVLLLDWMNDANDRTRDDFKKERLFPHASDKLDAIYEKEKVSGTVGFGTRRASPCWRILSWNAADPRASRDACRHSMYTLYCDIY